jgi:hypothetical protein
MICDEAPAATRGGLDEKRGDQPRHRSGNAPVNSEDMVRSASLLRKSIVERPAGIVCDGWLNSLIQIVCQCSTISKSLSNQMVAYIASHQMDHCSCLSNRHKINL